MSKLNGNVNNLIRTKVLPQDEWCEFCNTKHRDISWWLVREYAPIHLSDGIQVSIHSHYFCSQECYLLYCLRLV